VGVSGMDAVTVDITAGNRTVTLNDAFVGSSDQDTVTVNATAAATLNNNGLPNTGILVSAAVTAANTVVLGATNPLYQLVSGVNNRVTLGDVADTTNTGNGIAV